VIIFDSFDDNGWGCFLLDEMGVAGEMAKGMSEGYFGK